MKSCGCGQPVWSHRSCYCAVCKIKGTERSQIAYKLNNREKLAIKQAPRNISRAEALTALRAEVLGTPTRCELCGAKFGGGIKGHNWDHNHATGEGRGWLCRRCNAGLGCFGDNPILIDNAIKYLRTRGCSPTKTVLR